jgi:hypothetical protein
MYGRRFLDLTKLGGKDESWFQMALPGEVFGVLKSKGEPSDIDSPDGSTHSF